MSITVRVRSVHLRHCLLTVRDEAITRVRRSPLPCRQILRSCLCNVSAENEGRLSRIQGVRVNYERTRLSAFVRSIRRLSSSNVERARTLNYRLRFSLFRRETSSKEESVSTVCLRNFIPSCLGTRLLTMTRVVLGDLYAIIARTVIMTSRRFPCIRVIIRRLLRGLSYQRHDRHLIRVRRRNIVRFHLQGRRRFKVRHTRRL